MSWFSTCWALPTSSSGSEGTTAVAHAGRLAVLILAIGAAGCAARGPLLAPQTATDTPPAVELSGVPFHPQTRYQCGPAALATVLGASGVEVSPESLQPSVYLPGRRGSLQLELIAAARSHDRLPYELPADVDALLAEVANGRPVLVLQNFGLPISPIWHYAVVFGYDLEADRVFLRSGTRKRRSLSSRRFLGTWYRADRWAIVLLHPGELPARPDAARYRRAVSAFEATAGAEAALPAWRAAASRWPDDPVARVGIANGLYATGDLDGAAGALEQAVELAPDDPVVRNNLAHVLAERGCPGDARQHIEHALTLIDTDHSLQPQLTAAAERIAALGDHHCP